MMGGRIWVRSEVGIGSTFSFLATLQRANVPPTRPTHPAAVPKSALARKAGHLNILIPQKPTSLLPPLKSVACAKAASPLHGLPASPAWPPLSSALKKERGAPAVPVKAHVSPSASPIFLKETPPPSPQPPAASVAGLRLLLVEDNPVNQKVACHLLRKHGAQVDVVGDGQLAVDAMLERGREYDCVLMDIQVGGAHMLTWQLGI